MNDELMTDQK